MSNDFYKKFFENTPKEEEIEKKIEELQANYKNSAPYKEYVEQLNALYNDLSEERRNKKLEIGPFPKRDRGVKKIFDKKKDFNIKEYTDADRVLKEYEKLSKEDKRNFDIDNLHLVTRGQLAMLNKNSLIQKDAELTKTAINVVDLMKKISAIEKKDK